MTEQNKCKVPEACVDSIVILKLSHRVEYSGDARLPANLQIHMNYPQNFQKLTEEKSEKDQVVTAS